jgi:hypothetical protein
LKSVQSALLCAALAGWLAGCQGRLEDGSGGEMLEEGWGYPEEAGSPEVVEDEADLSYLRVLAVSVSGNDSWPGTVAQPFRTIRRALRAARPGDLIRVFSGTYPERLVIDGSVAAGTSTQPIRLQGEGMPRLVPQAGTPSSMLVIQRQYWEVAGFNIDVQGQPKYAVVFTGDVTGSKVTGCDIHGGSLGGGITTYGWARGALIEGNRIHHFSRGTQDSHGVVIQPTSQQITVRGNIIHNNSGDSVQCIGPEGYSSDPPARGVVIENNTMYGDREQAVDIKTCLNVVIRGNSMHDYIAAMVVHYSAADVVIDRNSIYNVGKGIAIGGDRGGPIPARIIVQRNKFWNVTRDTIREGVGVRLENADRARILNNTFYGIAWAAIRFGNSGDTTNLEIRNNIIQPSAGGLAYYRGAYSPGLATGTNLIAPGTQFSWLSGGTRRTGDLAAFRAASGTEAGSRSGTASIAPPSFSPNPTVVANWGANVGLPYCGSAPDVGAVETGC